MNEYIEAGLVVIQLTFLACSWAIIAVAFACLKGFVTDTIPSMPRHLSGILTMREDGYGGKNLRAIRDPIGFFNLFQTILIGIGITMGSMLVWPLYILLAVLYTIRAAYRARHSLALLLDSLMKTLRSLMDYRPERPETVVGKNSVEEPFVLKGDDVWEAVQKTQEACTCRGAPHDEDCAVLTDYVNVPPTYNKDHVPRWAKEPDVERKEADDLASGPRYTAPYKDGKMIHDKESS